MLVFTDQMKSLSVKILCFLLLSLTLVTVTFAQNAVNISEEHFFDSSDNPALETYFANHGLTVNKPIWQKTALLNPDARTLYEGTDYTFNVESEGIILSFDDAVKNDLLVSLINPAGKKEIYHRIANVTLSNVHAGTYKLRLEKSLTGAVNFGIYSSIYGFSTSAPLVVTPDTERYLHLNDNLQNYLNNGGTLINLGSDEINSWAETWFGGMEKLPVEGSNVAIDKFGQSYFYIPKQLFDSEERATQVIGVLVNQIGTSVYGIGNVAGVASILAVLILALFIWQHRKKLKKFKIFNGDHLVRKALLNFTVFVIFGISTLAILLYLYRNYSGLDLFPNFTIAGFIEQWRLQLISSVLFVAALFGLGFLVVSHVLTKLQTYVISGLIVFVGLAGLTAYVTRTDNGQKFQFVEKEFIPRFNDSLTNKIVIRSKYPLVKKQLGQNEILQAFMPNKEDIVKALDTKSSNTFYADVQNNLYFCYVEKPLLNGEILMREKNQNFGNKSFYLTLEDLSGANIKTIFYSSPEGLIGEASNIYQYGFSFENVKPGFYALRVENADPNNVGDYELVSVKIESGRIISINEVLATMREYTMELPGSIDATIEALQRDKYLDFSFLVK